LEVVGILGEVPMGGVVREAEGMVEEEDRLA
jgi:hypothetical protein